MPTRPLSADEAALWARVMAGVRPIAGRPDPAPVASGTKHAAGVAAPVAPTPTAEPPGRLAPPVPPRQQPRPQKPPRTPANTLDGSWDRDIARGGVSPDRTIDLHGHTLHSAHALLDAALDQSIRGGDRVILLVTGKPPRPASERPHSRGAIRAAVGDWLAGSRHAAAIAAVRAAHPRHGGAGALYIVLRRSRFTGAAPAKS